MEKQEDFVGRWLVSEYVYNPDGSFAGIVHQRRNVEILPNGNTHVVQHCEPSPELAGHPMGELDGEWIFERSRKGRFLYYIGPDMVGAGTAWGENLMTARGIWPRFGHNFTTFELMLTPELQIIGSKFMNAGEVVANIIGVAVPETDDDGDEWPEFSGTQNAGDIASIWQGVTTIFDDDTPSGSYERPITRRYQDGGWHDTYQDSGIEVHTLLQEAGSRLKVSGSQTGIAKRSGWLLEMEVSRAPQEVDTVYELLDAERGWLVSLRDARLHNLWCGLQLIVLKPVK
jgi:hypothetical protein